MKNTLLVQATLALCLSASGLATAQSATKYELTITNGSEMPISPAAIYVKTGSESAAPVGSQATAGFIKLCQSGNLATRLSELKADSSIKPLLLT